MGNIKEQEIATKKCQKPARKGEMFWGPVKMVKHGSQKGYGMLTKEASKCQ